MPKRVVFILGEPEYESHITMPTIAEELEDRGEIRASVCLSSHIPDNPDFPESHFPGLEALGDADLAVFYTRFRVLPDEQMQIIKAYLDSGRPVVGLRTATHSFRFPEGSPWHSWNAGFGRDVLGTPWISHHGGQSSTQVTKLPGTEGHPILEGIEDSFQVRSWLYKVLPLPEDCAQLLWGVPVGAERDVQENPVAWTRAHNGGRVFYTSLGHPDDLAVPSVRTLVMNGIRLALG